MKKFEKLECVLLIDDDAGTNFYHTVILEEEFPGLRIESVRSVKDGLEFLLGIGDNTRCPAPVIIFLDINMPGLDGWDFLREFNKIPKEIRDKSVIVILSTSNNPDDIEKSASFDSVKDYIEKPITPELFSTVVKQNFEKF